MGRNGVEALDDDDERVDIDELRDDMATILKGETRTPEDLMAETDSNGDGYIDFRFLKRSNKYQFVCLWFDPIEDRTLPHSLEHEQLHHIIDAVKARFKQMLHYISQKKKPS
jgi:hypothetical protein